VTLGPATATPASVVCPARPATALRGLEAITADARKAAGLKVPVPPAALRSPHMVLAYATGAGTTGPLEQRLAGRKTDRTGNPHIMVSAVQLARMRHDGRCVTWRTLETIAIGSGRRESRH